MPPSKIAVAIIHGVGHGVGEDDAEFAKPMMDELRDRFVALMPDEVDDPAAQLVLEPVYWAHLMQGAQNALWEKLEEHDQLDFVALRRFVIEFAGDAIAYQPSPQGRELYDTVHAEMARSLRKLAGRAGDRAPLCVIAHSLGSIIASNYVYDLQQLPQRDLVAASVHDEMGDTPLERGETFTGFYTMGGPLALWSLCYPDLGKAIRVPSPQLAQHHPNVEGEWSNFYDKDDVIGYPIKNLNPSYEAAVTCDLPVNVGGLLGHWNPMSHNGYWTDNDVTKPIAGSLVRLWQQAQ